MTEWEIGAQSRTQWHWGERKSSGDWGMDSRKIGKRKILTSDYCDNPVKTSNCASKDHRDKIKVMSKQATVDDNPAGIRWIKG